MMKISCSSSITPAETLDIPQTEAQTGHLLVSASLASTISYQRNMDELRPAASVLISKKSSYFDAFFFYQLSLQ